MLRTKRFEAQPAGKNLGKSRRMPAYCGDYSMAKKTNDLTVVESTQLTPETKGAASIDISTEGSNGLTKGNLSVLGQELLTKETIVPKTCDAYVSAFRLCAAKTARATLNMCRIVHEAREALDNDGFVQFCDQIGMAASPATVVKFCCIGRVYARFIKFEDRLPTSWTSIYYLTQVPDQYFDHMINKGKSLADLTGDQVKTLVKQAAGLNVIETELPKDGKTKRPIIGKLVFTKEKFDHLDYAAMKKAIQEMEARLPVKFITSKGADWPAPGFEDTKLGVLMEPEVRHGTSEVYTRVQA
jgi:hypothetical protein